jgi:hypothetical protein
LANALARAASTVTGGNTLAARALRARLRSVAVRGRFGAMVPVHEWIIRRPEHAEIIEQVLDPHDRIGDAHRIDEIAPVEEFPDHECSATTAGGAGVVQEGFSARLTKQHSNRAYARTLRAISQI